MYVFLYVIISDIHTQMKIKYNINFRLEKRKDKATGEIRVENLPINLDFTYEGKRFIFYTGYRIDECKWLDSNLENEKIQRVRKNAVNADGIQYNHINITISTHVSIISRV